LFRPHSAVRELASKAKRSVLADVAARYLRYTSVVLLSFLSYGVLPHPGVRAQKWALDWVLLVISRNMVIVYIAYGMFHWLLYECEWTRKKWRSQKFWDANLREDGSLDTSKGYNPVRDRWLTTVGVVCASILECVVLHLWAIGQWDSYGDLMSQPVRSLLLALALPYWADIHFFVIHRLIHPWCPRKFGRFDIGKFFYRHVHSVHHKSYNTGPWSGLAMHPVEQLLFFSSILVPIAHHPMHLYLGLFHKLIAPLAGHDGYATPGGDGYFHFLHHKYFEVNYGSPAVPLDRIFGSFSDGTQWSNKPDRKD